MATVSERLALVVTADTGGAVRELNKVGATAKSSLGDTEARLGRVSSSMLTMGAAATAGGLVAARGMYQAAEAAQGLADSVDKADSVFGSSRGLIAYAEGAASSMGLSKEAALDAASSYGLFLSQSGLAGQALATRSAQLAERTADLAEKYKKPYEEVQKSIENVIKTGSSRALRNLLGVGINVDPKQLEGLDAGAKSARLLEEILNQTADAAGTVAGSTDDIGVRYAAALAKWKNAQADLGESVIPVLTKIADSVDAVFDAYDRLPEPLKDAIAASATFATGAAIVGGAGAVIGGGMLKAVPGLTAAVAAMREGDTVAGKFSGALRAVHPAAIIAAVGIGSITAEALSARAALEDARREGAAFAETLALSETPYSDIGNEIAKDLRSAGVGNVLGRLGLDAESAGKLAARGGDGWEQFADKYEASINRVDPSIMQTLFNFNPEDFTAVKSADGIEVLQDALDELPPSIRRVVSGLVDLYEAGRIDGDQFRDGLRAFTDAGIGASRNAEDFTKLGRAIRENVTPETIAARGAIEDLETVMSKTAGFDAKLQAAQRLAIVFPNVTAKAGVLAFALGEVDTAAQTSAESVENAADASDRLKSANERVTSAQRRLAEATKRDGKTIEDAYARVVSAKERLDDILAGDGNNLEQESPQAQEERARAKLQEASFRLAANPDDALAQADKAEALQAITDAQQRGQDLLRNAQDIARQTRDAQRDLEDAQQTYNEQLVGNPEEVQAAREELATAERDRAKLLSDLGVAFQEGKISVEAYKAELDRQVAAGIISPESAAILKAQADDLTTQVGLAAAASGALAVVTGQITTNLQTVSDQLATAARVSSASAIGAAARVIAGRFGGSDNRPTVNPSTGGYYPGRASGGIASPGVEYRINEAGVETLITSQGGYILNADRTRQLTSGSTTNLNAPITIIEARAPRQTAAAVVRKMKARKFMMAGA